MSEIRSVSVHLDADVASYIAKMRLAGAETDRAFSSSSRSIGSTNTGLKTTETSLAKVDTQARKVDSSMSRVNTRFDSGRRSIDKYSGRLGILVDSLAAVGPALIPISAELIPLVTTAAADLGFLAAAGGVTVLAFHGLGTALTAFNKAELDPTVANIHAAQLAMDKLPPATQAFVVELHALNPELTKLRQSAASGVMPGLTQGLQSAVTVGPLAQRTIHGIALEMGSLAEQAGKAVSGPEGRAFLKFFGRETPLALHQIGDAAGYGADGVFQLVKAFTPLTHDVNAGLVRVAQDFDRWATNLNKTKDFQSFMQYIQTNGPRVEALLSGTASLFVDIVKAAAPLGGPTLQALTLIVHALDLIASSPLATPLLALAQINSVLRLTSRGLGAVGVSSNVNLKSRLTANAKSASTAMFGVVSAQDRAKMSAKDLEEQQAKSRAAFAGSALAIGGLALASSGAADAMGLQNTTMLATTGLMVGGPWGAAIGGGAGLLLDMANAARNDKAQLDGLNNSVQGLASSGNIAALGKLSDSAHQLDQFANLGGGFGIGLGTSIGTKLAIPEQAFASLSATISDFNTQLTGQAGPVVGLTDLQQVANRMQPAMTQLGLTFDDLLHMNSDDLQTTIDRLVHITNAAESIPGKTNAVAKAFAGMSNEAQTTTDRVTALTTALDGLIDPMLQLGAAHDAFRQGLNDLDQGLSKNSKTLRGNSDAAIQNRGAVRDQVNNLKSWIEAEAQAHPHSKTLVSDLMAGRQAIIDQGKAAGLNAQQIQHMLDVMHLTPKFIKTLIQTAGVPQVLSDLQKIHVQIAGLHNKTIVIRTIGVNTVGTGGRNVPGAADGGTVHGPRAPYGDKVLTMLAPGEEVISNRHGQADAFRRDRAMGRIPGYADGGTVTHVTSTPSGAYMTDFAGALAVTTSRLHLLQTELKTSTDQLTAERQARQALAQQRAQVVSTVRDSMRSQILGVTPDNIWAGGQTTNPLSILRGDIGQARQFKATIAQLRRRGLSGGVVSQITDLADAQQVASLSDHQLKQLQHLYAVRQRVTQAAGASAGDLGYGKQMAEQTRAIHGTNQRIDQLNREVAHLRKEAPGNAKTTGDAVGNNINGAAGTAVRRARRR